MILGIVTNFTTGLLVNKVSAIHAVLVTSGLCAVAPLLMAVVNPSWSYWYDAFFAQVSPKTRSRPNLILTPNVASITVVSRCAFHNWNPYHFRFVSSPYTSTRWSRVQHACPTGYIDWVDHIFRHSGCCNKGLCFSPETVSRSFDAGLSSDLLDIVCMDGDWVHHRSSWFEERGSNWTEARLRGTCRCYERLPLITSLARAD